ncbi:MAG: hypothetical protein KAQ63_02890, partial [Candidatus Moranbacteria bacterium]|nr:hypothetical protein [Candidatus Moranbacteria bacterium]
RLKNIQKILKEFTGTNGEPENEKEIYLLKAMWVMLCAEFEGSTKDLVESYVDSIKKTKRVKDMHIAFLLQNFLGEKKEKGKLTKKIIFNLFKIKKVDIKILNFINNKKAIYKSEAVEYLFNSLGIFFTKKELAMLKLLDGIASTRDSISHGDRLISITRKQLEGNIPMVRKIYNMLKRKLK